MTMTPASALAFFASVIKSGEPWTPACQQAMDEALAHLTQPPRATPEPTIFYTVREVIAELRDYNEADDGALDEWADKLTAALQEKGNG